MIKVPDILWGVEQISGSGCANSERSMKYFAEYFILLSELSPPRARNLSTSSQTIRGFAPV